MPDMHVTDLFPQCGDRDLEVPLERGHRAFGLHIRDLGKPAMLAVKVDRNGHPVSCIDAEAILFEMEIQWP
jgi:hypothetical protein